LPDVSIFIHIPKTGGMSISKALKIQKFRDRRRLRPGAEYSGIVTFGHEPLPWLQQHDLAPRDAFVFAFVRNPYDRAVSLWAFNNKRNQAGLTFAEFCRALPRLGWRIRNPQMRWLEGVTLGFLGRFERLQQDFEQLCGILGVERRKALPHLNEGERGVCSDYYDWQTATIVREHYAVDFERLGYDSSTIPG